MRHDPILHATPVNVDETPAGGGIRYSILTLVTDSGLYAEMIASFRAGGFDLPDCEFLFVDNRGPQAPSAYAGLNRLMSEAKGEILILCHQDVRLLRDRRVDLDLRLAELTSQQPKWGIAGNAGGTAPGQLALRITDGHGTDRRVGNLPERVASLDENFMVVRASSRLAFSGDLAGFHFYGSDLCVVADILGYSAHVIDFHLEHLSKGNNQSDAFRGAERAFRAKWARALRPRWVQTTCSLVYLSGQPVLHAAGGAARRLVSAVARRLPTSRGFNEPRKAAQR